MAWAIPRWRPHSERQRGLTSEEADTATIAAALERAIAKHLGVRPKVIVLTRAELAQVVEDNPFPDEPNPRWVHAIVRNGPLGPDELAAVAAAQQRAQDQGSDDEARVVGTTLFPHTPGGLGRSELAAQLTRLGGSRTAETAGTARNRARLRRRGWSRWRCGRSRRRPDFGTSTTTGPRSWVARGRAPGYAMALDEGQRAVLREELRARLPVAGDGSIALAAQAWAVRATVVSSSHPAVAPSPAG